MAGTTGRNSMDLAGQQTAAYKPFQAINADYVNTGYDRGHLNPNSYQCDDSRTATFTLTNAVPQDPCFNEQSWKQMEGVSLRTMRTSCSFPGAERYFVTGVVKRRTRIPNEEHDVEGDRTRQYNRVTIPSHMWTAVCCYDSTNQGKGFSFAYIGENTADAIVETIPVSELEAKLVSTDLGADRYDRVSIFTDDCNEDSDLSKRIRAQVSVPNDVRVANTVDDLSRVEQSSIPIKKRKLVHQAVSLISSNKVVANSYSIARLDLGMTLTRSNTLLSKTRDLLLAQGASVLLFEPHDITAVDKPPHGGEHDAYGIYTGSAKQAKNKTVLRSRRTHLDEQDDGSRGETSDQTNTPVEDNYLIVPNLAADGSDVTLTGDRCINSSCHVGGGTFHKWCYKDWKKTQGQCCVSECNFRRGKNYQTCYTEPDNSAEKACSSRFSTIAVSAQRCLADHECGLHGYGYYWCYVDLAKNWDYCCQPWHPCDHYGEKYKWCYAGQTKQSKWKYCFY